MKKYLIIGILIVLLPISTKACSSSDMSVLSKMYSNVEISYLFNESTEKFEIKISNLNKNLYIYSFLNQNYIYPSSGEEIFSSVNPGSNYRFHFYGNYNSCSKSSIASKYITLPSYNKYYKDPLCKGFENYKVCQKWAKVNYTYDEFKKEIDSYKNSEPNKQKEEEEVLGFYDHLALFYKKYYYIILPLVITVLSVLIYMQYKKNKLF